MRTKLVYLLAKMSVFCWLEYCGVSAGRNAGVLLMMFLQAETLMFSAFVNAGGKAGVYSGCNACISAGGNIAILASIKAGISAGVNA